MAIRIGDKEFKTLAEAIESWNKGDIIIITDETPMRGFIDEQISTVKEITGFTSQVLYDNAQ